MNSKALTAAVVGAVAVAGVAGALLTNGPSTSESPTPATSASAGAGTIRNERPGRLPSIAIADAPEGTSRGAGAPGATAGAAPSVATEPTVEALAARLAELEARLAAVAPPTAAPVAMVPGLAGLLPPQALASLPPSKPAPTIVKGTEHRSEGPILYDPGPPWPFHEGLRGPPPPHVAGAGCATCESAAGTER